VGVRVEEEYQAHRDCADVEGCPARRTAGSEEEVSLVHRLDAALAVSSVFWIV
jgi:hypothetical protein